MRPDLTATLHTFLSQRILVLDGAMGTMIQGHRLAEADYRGVRFADFEHDLKGNNDILSITQMLSPNEVAALITDVLSR